MNTLDRYIARQYLINIFLLFLLLCSFVVMVDLSMNLQRYLGLAKYASAVPGAAPASGLRQTLMALLLLADLWWPRLLQLYNYLLGLILIGAMGFTFAQLVRHREMVAVLASGISLYRMMLPVLVVAAAMIGLQVVNQELVLPQLIPLLARNNTQIQNRDLSAFPVRMPDGNGNRFLATAFDPATGVLSNLHVYLRRDNSDRATDRISASAARFERGVWVLTDGVDHPLTLPSAAQPTTQPDRPVASIASDLTPTALVASRYRGYASNLSTLQLADILAGTNLKPDLRERLDRIAWGRFAAMVCTVLSLIISIPYFLTREPRNMVLQSIKCAPVALGTVLGSVLGTAAAIPGIPVPIAVFLPVLALAPMAIAMGTSIKT